MMSEDLKLVNGKNYPMWQQFVDKKDDFIGLRLVDFDIGMRAETIVTDVVLIPNGDDSAWFGVKGEEFECGFDVSVGGISGQKIEKNSVMTFTGYMGHTWEIQK